MGICTREWVCRSFSLVIPIGKSNTFNPRLVPTLLHTDKLHCNSRQNSLIKFCFRHLSITSWISCLGLFTPSCPIYPLVILNHTPWDHLFSYPLFSGTYFRCQASTDPLLFVSPLVPGGLGLPPELSHFLTCNWGPIIKSLARFYLEEIKTSLSTATPTATC